jgi:hypothetical protein
MERISLATARAPDVDRLEAAAGPLVEFAQAGISEFVGHEPTIERLFPGCQIAGWPHCDVWEGTRTVFCRAGATQLRYSSLDQAIGRLEQTELLARVRDQTEDQRTCADCGAGFDNSRSDRTSVCGLCYANRLFRRT